MVKPIPVIAFTILWHVAFGFLNLILPDQPDVPSCNLIDAITEGCSSLFAGFVLGTIEGAQPITNYVLEIIDVIILSYFVWVVVNVVRPGVDSG